MSTDSPPVNFTFDKIEYIPMAFGFPAYHTERYDAQNDIDLRSVAKETLAQLSWVLRTEGSMEILASTSLNLRTWGEKVTIKFEDDRSISITSRCALPTQCFDWGKNRANVVKYIAALKQRVEQVSGGNGEQRY